MKIIINNKYTYPRRVLLNETLAERGRAMLRKYIEKGGVSVQRELKQAFNKPSKTNKKTD